MKRTIIIFVVLVSLLVGCIIGKQFCYVDHEHLVLNPATEYAAVFSNKTENNKFADKLVSHMDVQYGFWNTRWSKSVKCTFTYPDLYSYWYENADSLNMIEPEELKTALADACETQDSVSVTVTLPAEYSNGYLLMEPECFAYQNAKTCGLLGVMAEEYSESIRQTIEEVFAS